MAKKFMIFTLGPQRYGISLHVVREVIGLPKITPVPGMPPEFRGLINLRGRIIPTLDTVLKLNPKGNEQKQRRATIIIADLDGSHVGLIVEEVVEVIPVEDNQIDTDIEKFSETSHRSVIGVAKYADRDLTLILGLDRLVSVKDLQANTAPKSDSSAA